MACLALIFYLNTTSRRQASNGCSNGENLKVNPSIYLLNFANETLSFYYSDSGHAFLFREELSGNIYPVYYSKPFPNGEFGCGALPANGKECVVTPRVGSIAKAYR